MLAVSPQEEEHWLSAVSEALRYEGCAVVTDVVADEPLGKIRAAMYEVQEHIRGDLGEERLARAGELGVLRLMARYNPAFLELLQIPEMQAIVDIAVSDTSVLHLQNGFILPPHDPSSAALFQQTFHRDFPRYLDGYIASVNVLVTVDAFTRENGGTLVVPGTHQRGEPPTKEYMEMVAEPVSCPAGSLLVFDSTLWHAAGLNCSTADRVAINHQFTRSFFKQQIDYVRALGEDVVLAQPPRIQQMLGWYTRVVTSLDEYYRPSHERLYHAGQG